MKRLRSINRSCRIVLAAVIFICSGFVAIAFGAAAPRLLILNLDELNQAKNRLDANDATLLPALNRLKRDADRALSAGPFAVTHKELTPPSGDKHDYMSIAPYWWPNPNAPNGLPYIRRDGVVNPERDQTSDRKRFADLVYSVNTLAQGYFFTGREDYAAYAAKLLRVWFLDDASKMNPHLRYAQAVPGRNLGRGAGIIETHNLPELLDAVGLLAGSNHWSEVEQKTLQEWFGKYLTWLLDGAEGKAEAKAQNNHGTWYDVQVAAFALFAGRDDVAKQLLSEFSAKRIAKQVEADGRQPQELERTQSWHYSIFNLEAIISAASLGDKLGVDLWNFESADKRSIRKALDWLTPFASGEKKWSYQQITPFEPEKLAPLLRRAALRSGDPSYENVLAKLAKSTSDERWQLHFPGSK
ncbi:MAG: hypothetical protein EXR70_21530 [Deltaproteobacteria bacterium]|nr:hypothetical protein [Deltaproteobacteria bacterium]